MQPTRAKAKAAGETRYFTGKPCKRGHIAPRQSANGQCVSCGAEDTARYYADEEKRKKMLAHAKRWKDENAEKLAEQRKEKWQDPEFRKKCAEYLDKNRQKYLEYYWVANMPPEKVAIRRAQRRASPNKNTQAANRRALVRGAEGRHTRVDVDRILKQQGNKCAWCKTRLTEKYHVDHIMPLSKGGSNWPNNLQCLCETCNVRKSAKHPLDWARQNGRLL